LQLDAGQWDGHGMEPRIDDARLVALPGPTA
jgi:hypothetical protein